MDRGACLVPDNLSLRVDKLDSNPVYMPTEKFLIDRDGNPVKRYEPSPSVSTTDIEELLAKKSSS